MTPPLKQGHKRCSKEGPERREKKSVEFGDVLQVIYNGIGQHRLNKLTSFGLMNILYIYIMFDEDRVAGFEPQATNCVRH